MEDCAIPYKEKPYQFLVNHFVQSTNPFTKKYRFQVCIFVGQLISFIIVLTFPPLFTAFGSRVLVFYSVLSALSAIIFYFFVPETRGTDVDDMIHKISICYVGQLRRASHELGDDTQPLLARPRLRKLTSYM